MPFSLLVLIVFAAGLCGQTDSGLAMEMSTAKQASSIAVQRQSAAVQKASLRRQPHVDPAPSDSFFVLEAVIPATPISIGQADCEPLSELEISPLIDGAAEKQGLSGELLRAVMRQESAFRPCAVSAKGAQGLMQLMPATAGDLGVNNPFDPEENVDGGARLLRQLMDRYAGDLNRVLGAYNAGAARVDAADGIPKIPETLHYVESILGNLGVQRLR